MGEIMKEKTGEVKEETGLAGARSDEFWGDSECASQKRKYASKYTETAEVEVEVEVEAAEVEAIAEGEARCGSGGSSGLSS
jgi:hypothetical protein